ncbi:MAG: Cna B-type domain-containing protein, partial [Clostridia bacterium]|nr:Cna B-type domain-containing protein [Clostridia bacterium]
MTKLWASSVDGKTATPVPVTVELLGVNGVAVENSAVELNESNSWTYVWEDVPVYNESTWTEIEYSVKEVGEQDGKIALNEGKQRYEVTYG